MMRGIIAISQAPAAATPPLKTRKTFRSPVEEDTELALHALIYAIRDPGWST
jgi:hypothetical protein